MKTLSFSRRLVPVMLLALGFVAGCESTDSGGSATSGGFYYGVGLYDPWYYGGYEDHADIIVRPPGAERPIAPPRPERPIAPPRPEQPIARPTEPRPTPRPSIPSTPRAMPRGGGRR